MKLRASLWWPIMLTSALACQSTTTPLHPIVGTYALQSVDGAALPAEIAHSGCCNAWYVDALSRTYAFHADGTVTVTGQSQVYRNGALEPPVEDDDAGTYAVHGNSVTVTLSSGLPRDGTITQTGFIFPPATGYYEVYVRQGD